MVGGRLWDEDGAALRGIWMLVVICWLVAGVLG
jgi:hypothetical protein